MTTETLTGHAAIDYAEAHGLKLSKHADPTEGARGGLSPIDAFEVAVEDPSLIWLAIPATITDEQIEALQIEAGGAGDAEQVAICERALDGDADARGECVDVICEARLA